MIAAATHSLVYSTQSCLLQSSTCAVSTIRPTVIDKIQPNRTNRIKLGCPIIILLVHGSLDGRTLSLHGMGG